MKKDERYYEQEEKLKSSIFFVEANFFEVLTLWEKHKDEYLWETGRLGFCQVIGYISGHKSKPVNVSFMFDKINNERICFFEVVSRYNDSEMVENWLNKHYPKKWDNNSRIAITNAMNFHHAIQAIEEKVSKRKNK